MPCQLRLFLCRCVCFLHQVVSGLGGKKKREERDSVSVWRSVGASSRHAFDRNTRHSHPWSDVVGGRGGVSGWECTGELRTGGRVRRVWMVLDGSKEASLPSCGDKPSLALQQRVTHSITQWRIFLGQIGFPPLTRLFRSINQMHPLLVFFSCFSFFVAFYIPPVRVEYLSRDLPVINVQYITNL